MSLSSLPCRHHHRTTLPEATNLYFGASFLRRLGPFPHSYLGPDVPFSLRWIILIPVLLTLLALSTGLYAIASRKYQDSQKKWAYGAVGIILGYWLG